MPFPPRTDDITFDFEGTLNKTVRQLDVTLSGLTDFSSMPWNVG